MSRKISIAIKKQWLQEFDEGKSHISIATKHKRDVRTIKKGIEEARRERDATLARADLLKEALHRHNKELLNLLEQLAILLQPLPASQAIPWRKFDEGSLALLGVKAQYETWNDARVWNISLDIEPDARWQLLLEHLKQDPLPKALSLWRKTLSSHIEARINVKQKLAELLETKTGYQLEDELAGDRCIVASAVDHLFHYLLMDLPRPVNVARLVNNIAADSNTGQVKYGAGTTLALARGEEEDCKNNIIDALKELSRTEEIDTLIETCETHKTSIDKASKAVEEIRMMGLVPGQCRICRRLGI